MNLLSQLFVACQKLMAFQADLHIMLNTPCENDPRHASNPDQ